MEAGQAGDDARGSLLSVTRRRPDKEEAPSEQTTLPRMSAATRIIHTILIFSTFLGFGLCRGVYGPTLMELRAITQVSLTQVSMLFTCLGVGGIAGSLTFGRLFDLFNPLVLFVVALVGVGVVTTLIPHLPLLSLMMAACAAHSFLYSGLAIGCTVTLFRLWRECSRQIFLSMHLLYTIGGFLAPLLSEPFLTPTPHRPDTNTSRTLRSSSANLSALGTPASAPNAGGTGSEPVLMSGSDPIVSVLPNFTDTESEDLALFLNNTGDETGGPPGYADFEAPSRIFFTYLIMGVYLLTVAAGMFGLLLYMCNKDPGVYWRDNQPKGALPCRGGTSLFKLLATVLFMAYNVNFGGQETVYSGLLFTFAVKHVGFSVTRGSLLVSMLYTANTVGRFGVILVSHWVPNAMHVLACSVVGCAVACSIMAHFTTTNVCALWAATVLGGLSMSTMYTMGLLWAKDFVPITATFTSLYTIAYTCGMMLWPPLTSYFMKTRSGAWFAYMNLILLINYSAALAFLFTLQKLRHRFKNSEVVEEKVIECKVRQNDELIAHSMHSLHAV